MNLEIVKPIIKVGNSAGVLLPRAWLNGEAKVKLIRKPANINEDIIKLLENYLSKIIGVYIVGSYARNEQKKDSDVDVLAVTENINSNIKKGKYDIILISKQQLENKLKNNILPILPMLIEAKPLINPELISQYKYTTLTKRNLRFHIETTKSAMRVVKKFIDLDTFLKKQKTPDDILYSLILRMREIYIVECLRKNKIPTNKEFLTLVKRISGSEDAYYAYKRSKEKSSQLERTSIESARKIYEYNKQKIAEQEKWAAGKGRERENS